MGGERIEPWDTFARWSPAQPDVTAPNGDGSSYATALVVFTTLAEVSTAEDKYILWQSEPHPMGHPVSERSDCLERSKDSAGGKVYDIVRLTRDDGTTKTFYFDVSHLKMQNPRGRGQ